MVAYEPVPAVRSGAAGQRGVELARRASRSAHGGGRHANAGRASFRFDRRQMLLGGVVSVDAEDTQPVEVVALGDDLAGEARIDLVKIDVEGGEADVLAGLAALLATPSNASASRCAPTPAAGWAVAQWGRPTRRRTRRSPLGVAGWTFAVIGPSGAGGHADGGAGRGERASFERHGQAATVAGATRGDPADHPSDLARWRPATGGERALGDTWVRQCPGWEVRT